MFDYKFLLQAFNELCFSERPLLYYLHDNINTIIVLFWKVLAFH